MFANGEHKVPLLPLSSGVYVCSFRPAYPADPDCADTSMPGRARQLPHSGAHSAYPRPTPDQSVKMRPNLFFIDFHRSGDCLFIFLRYIFHGLFFLSFDYGLVTIINQETNRSFSRAFFQNVRNFPNGILIFCLF